MIQGLVLLGLYILAGYAGVHVQGVSWDAPPVVWLCPGVGVLILLLMRRGGLAALIVASSVVAVLDIGALRGMSRGLAVNLATGAVDVLQAWLAWQAWQLLQKRCRHPLLSIAADVMPVVLFVCLLPAMVGCWLPGMVANEVDFSSYVANSAMRALSVATGIFLVVPLYRVLTMMKERGTPGRPVDWMAQATLTSLPVAASYWLFPSWLLLIIPALLIGAVRLQLYGSSVAMLWLACITLIGTSHGLGLFAASDAHIAMFNLQLFLFALGVTAHFIALSQMKLRGDQELLEALVQERTQALQLANTRLEHLATTDELTGILNRREWLRLGGYTFDRASRYHEPLSVLLLDIDHFKAINDTHGHFNGDEVLRRVSQSCQRHLRGTDVFGRWGGEEFAVLLPATCRADAEHAARKLLRAVADYPIPIDGGVEIKVTISIGLAEMSGEDKSVEETLRRADICLYAAKRSGRNVFVGV